jgi:tryptophan synthase alpha chain
MTSADRLNDRTRLGQAFARRRAEGRAALIAYVTGGYPSMTATFRALAELESAGVDVVEIGVPFSDPIADGPTIQFASQAALAKGATLTQILDGVRGFRRTSVLPIVLMSYLNPILSRGLDRFAREAAEAGVDGLIVPDVIPEEAGPLKAAMDKAGVAVIFLVAPTTPPKRRAWIARQSRGFLYAVSLTGVTGARRELSRDLPAFLKDLRRVSPVPVAVGFGISTPDQARAAAAQADGVIVGSAIIQRQRDGRPLAPFARALRRALDQ